MARAPGEGRSNFMLGLVTRLDALLVEEERGPRIRQVMQMGTQSEAFCYPWRTILIFQLPLGHKRLKPRRLSSTPRSAAAALGREPCGLIFLWDFQQGNPLAASSGLLLDLYCPAVLEPAERVIEDLLRVSVSVQPSPELGQSHAAPLGLDEVYDAHAQLFPAQEFRSFDPLSTGFEPCRCMGQTNGSLRRCKLQHR